MLCLQISSIECGDQQTKDAQINSLQRRVQEYITEIAAIRDELDKKKNEIRNFTQKTDEYIRYQLVSFKSTIISFRKREHQRSQALEKKIADLTSEHVKAIEQLKNRESMLLLQIEQLQQQKQRFVSSFSWLTILCRRLQRSEDSRSADIRNDKCSRQSKRVCNNGETESSRTYDTSERWAHR